MAKTILITGGAGYIGSHTVLQLLLGGFRAVVVDNLDNSSEIAIHRVKELAAEFGDNLVFHKVQPSRIFFFLILFCLNSSFVECVASIWSFWALGVSEFVHQFENFDRLLGFLFVSDFVCAYNLSFVECAAAILRVNMLPVKKKKLKSENVHHFEIFGY